MTINGWFEGDSHPEVVEKYQRLIEILKVPDVKVTYFDGNDFVINDQVCFIDNYAEPINWKEYTGDYKVTFHYIEELSHGSYLNLNVSFSSPAGVYTFETTPLWTAKIENVRGSKPGANEKSPSGRSVGSIVSVALKGELAANSHNELASKIGLMSNAFSRDGVLNYGIWSNTVDVTSPPSYGPTLPQFVCPFTVAVAYKTESVYEFSATSSYTRIHPMADIRKRKYCPTDYIKLNRDSSQEVTYSLMARGDSIDAARAFLKAEAWNLVIPGGVDMDGGNEVHDEMQNSVTITIKKFYLTPVMPNVDT